MWHIELLGGVKAISGDREVSHFETRQATSLLAFLACHRDRPHPREVLAEMLWPDEDVDATRDRLRQALSALRRALEPAGVDPGSVLQTDRSQVTLADGSVSTDVDQFIGRAKGAEREAEPERRLSLLREAIELYRGELMPGHYDSWLIAERGRLSEMFYDCLWHAAELSGKANDLQEAQRYARRAVAQDPLREEAHACLIRLYAANGRAADALRQYREMERALREELGVEPSATSKALVAQLLTRAAPDAADASGAVPVRAVVDLEAEGGAVPLGSPFYVVRPTDSEFLQAIIRNDSIVLVKGARQIGKTSLLARGLQHARERGARVVLTDVQKLTESQLASAEALFYTLAESIADQLDLDVSLDKAWSPSRGWNVNFERFMRREALATSEGPIIWGLDEVDLLFAYPYSKSVFGLFRAWHNERSLDPDGPWSRLTLAIAYATEAHLFISDLNQSPFNVGTRLTLEDFTVGEVAELNRRYGRALKGEAQIKKFVDLVGGHPYLVRRGLHALACGAEAFEGLTEKAAREDGVYGDHLARMYHSLCQDGTLCDAMREVLNGGPCPSPESFYRLQSAGLIAGSSDTDAKPRCRLYREYLARRLN